MENAKVKGSNDLAKNMHTGVVQNINKQAYNAYIKTRNAFLKNRERLDSLEQTVETISSKLDAIVALLEKQKGL